MGSDEQTAMRPEAQRYVLPLKAMTLAPSEKVALLSLLGTHQRSLLSGRAPMLLETHASANMYLKNFFNTQFVGTVVIESPPQCLDVFAAGAGRPRTATGG